MPVWLWILIAIFLLITWRPAGALAIRLDKLFYTGNAYRRPDDITTTYSGWIFLVCLLISVIIVGVVYALIVLVGINAVRSFGSLWNGGVPKMKKWRKKFLDDIMDGKIT